jgi:dodecin
MAILPMEENMNPNKRNNTADAQPSVVTGGHGAIDFAANQEALNINSEADPDHHTYRVIELVGTSEDSIEHAIDTAIVRAHKTLRNLRWFEVTKTSGHIESGKIRHFQVTLKVGFTMEEVR